MNSRLTLSILIAVSIAVSVDSLLPTSSFASEASKRVRPERNFNKAQESAPEVSKFSRRLDYREEEKLHRLQAEEADKREAASARRAELEAQARAKRHSDSAINANNRGVAFGQARRWAEAIAAHEQAVELDLHNKQFKINLSAARAAYGQEKLASGDYTAAAGLFRKALVAAPDNGLAGKLLVTALRKQGRDPSNVDVRLEIGDQLVSSGDLESATVEYQAAMQLEPSARTYLKMGDMALHYGQISTASNWYGQALVKEPKYGPAHRQLGLLAMSQNNLTDAASSLRQALVLDAKDAAAGQSLVTLWRRQVAQNPLLAENHLGLAGALQLTGDFAGAESEYQRLAVLDPQNSALESGRASLARAIQHAEAEKHRAAAETLATQNLHREALAEIGRAVQMEPRNSRYQFILAECLEAVGDRKQAHQVYLNCVLMDPEKNQEAAARMRDMQREFGKASGASAGAYNNAQQAPVQQAQMQSQMQAQPAMQQSQMQGAQQSQMQAQSAMPQQGQAPLQQQVQTQVSQQQAQALQSLMATVAQLEAAQNYQAAIVTLAQALQTDLKNADVHHRLAVNLLAAGHINEAISEFRMASALRPGNQDFAADLARAMAIHKRSQQSGAGVASSKEGAR